jgi:hypothetical protein
VFYVTKYQEMKTLTKKEEAVSCRDAKTLTLKTNREMRGVV